MTKKVSAKKKRKKTRKTKAHKIKKSSSSEHESFLEQMKITFENDLKREKILIENFVSLQKVLTNLSEKVGSLTNKTSKLLDLFESSAKSLVEKDLDLGKGNEDVVKKLDNLLEQNKVLARGISLMHEKPSGADEVKKEVSPPIMPSPQKLPPLPKLGMADAENKPIEESGYQKSISSGS